jgi:hypothetical protein
LFLTLLKNIINVTIIAGVDVNVMLKLEWSLELLHSNNNFNIFITIQNEYETHAKLVISLNTFLVWLFLDLEDWANFTILSIIKPEIIKKPKIKNPTFF